jgi:hypothetical protein
MSSVFSFSIRKGRDVVAVVKIWEHFSKFPEDRICTCAGTLGLDA